MSEVAQEQPVLNPEFQEQLIQEYLLDNGVITPSQLSRALARLREIKIELQKNQQAVSYVMDQKSYALKRVNPWTSEVLDTLSLPTSRKFKPRYFATDWHPIGSGSVYLFHSKNAREIGEIYWGEQQEEHGLTVSDRFVHIYFGGLDEHPYLALTDALYAPIVPMTSISTLPVDIILSADHSHMFLSDRGRGTIFIVDRHRFKLLGSLVVRPPGSKKTLNLASSPDGSRLFITDHSSPALYIVNTRSLKIKRHPLPYGILGNLQISPDGQWLYLENIRTDRSVEVIVIDTRNFLHKTTIPLRGELFSLMDDPCDLMALSPENNYLLLMTYVNAPAMFTPWINIVDLESNQLIDRYALLSDDNKPTYLSFAITKPDGYFKVDIGILEILLEMGYISLENVEEAELTIQETLRRKEEKPVLELQLEPELTRESDDFETFSIDENETEAIQAVEQKRGRPEEEYPVLHQYQIDPSILIRFKESLLRQFEFIPINQMNGLLRVGAVNPEREEIEWAIRNFFPEAPLQMIPISGQEFERFMQEFYQFIMIRMRNILSTMSPEQKSQFQETAPEGVMENLDTFQSAPEQPEPLAPENAEEKENIAKQIEEKTEQIAEKTEANNPENIDAIPTKTRDSVMMAYCLNEFKKIWGIDISEETAAIKSLKPFVKKACQELKTFDYTIIRIPDLFNGFALETVITKDQYHKMLQIAPQTLPGNKKDKRCQSCGASVNLGVAYCMKCAPQINEETAEELPPSSQENLPPGHFLANDQDRTRIIEFTNKGQIIWQVGGMDGIGNLDLLNPQAPIRLPNGNTLFTDAGHDHVYEVSKSGQIRWQFPPTDRPVDIELRTPVKALRKLNGNTIIVDQGNHRIIEINHMNKIVWQYGITSSVGISRGRLYSPNDVQCLKGGRFLIADTDNHRIIEVTQDEEIIWQYGNPENKLGSGYGSGPNQLNMPTYAIRLANGHTLIADSENRRVIEVTPDKKIVWRFDTGIEEQSGGQFSFVPQRLLRLDNGNTIVFSPIYVIEVTYNLRPLYLYQYALLPKADNYEEQRQESDKIVELSTKPSTQHISELAKKATQQYIRTKSKLMDIQIPLIDKQENKVFLLNRQKQIIWRFGEKNPQREQHIQRPQCVSFIPGEEEYLLLTDTDRHRVLQVYRPTKEVVWQYGETGVMGSSEGRLGHPRSATWTPQETVLITDQYSGRVIEINKKKEIVWSFGGWDDGINPLNAPYYAEKTKDDTVLITDWSNHYVIEVNQEGEIIWQYGTLKNPGNTPHQLMYPERAKRLENGNTLIVDTRNHRVLEVDPAGGIFWRFDDMKADKSFKKISNPTAAYRLENGNTVIVHSGNRQVIEVTLHNEVVWQYLRR